MSTVDNHRRSVPSLQSLCRRLVFLFIVLSPWVWPVPVAAQLSYEAEFLWRTGITRWGVERFIDDCNLTEEQAAAAQRLLAAHTTRFKAFVLKNKPGYEALEAAYKNGEPSTLPWYELKRKAGDQAISYYARQVEMEQRILDQFEAILTEEQLPAWKFFVQRLHRRWWLPVGWRYREERIDLIAIVEEMELGDTDVVEPELLSQHLHSYSRALDNGLVRRRQWQIAWARKEWKLEPLRIETDGHRVWIGRPSPDPDQRTKDRAKLKKQAKTHRDIRDVNRRYWKLIAATLAPERVGEFLDLYQHNPAYFAGTYKPGLKYLLRVEALESLSQEQQEAVGTVRAWYEPEARSLDGRIIEADNKWTDARLNLDSASTRKPARAKYYRVMHWRYDLEERLVEKLWALLPPQQRALLPKPKPIDRSDWK